MVTARTIVKNVFMAALMASSTAGIESRCKWPSWLCAFIAVFMLIVVVRIYAEDATNKAMDIVTKAFGNPNQRDATP